jgi:hypothetical protein
MLSAHALIVDSILLHLISLRITASTLSVHAHLRPGMKTQKTEKQNPHALQENQGRLHDAKREVPSGYHRAPVIPKLSTLSLASAKLPKQNPQERRDHCWEK